MNNRNYLAFVLDVLAWLVHVLAMICNCIAGDQGFQIPSGFQIPADISVESSSVTSNDLPRFNVIGSAGAVQDSITDVEFWTAPFYCPPCNWSFRQFANGQDWAFDTTITTGDGRLKITKRLGPADWMQQFPNSGYPFFRFKLNGQQHTYYGRSTPAGLLGVIESLQAESGVQSGSNAVSLTGTDGLRAALESFVAFAGDGASVKVRLVRRGGKSALPINETHSMQDVVGTSGRFELAINSTASKLPVHELKFAYRFDGKRLFIRPDEFEVEIPESNIVSGAAYAADGKQGAVIMTALTVLSMIYNTYQVLHPEVSIWLGDDIAASATVKSGAVAIDLGPRPPAVHVNWKLFFGWLTFDYQRALTGLVIGGNPSVAQVQFHQSRFYRDVTIPLK